MYNDSEEKPNLDSHQLSPFPLTIHPAHRPMRSAQRFLCATVALLLHRGMIYAPVNDPHRRHRRVVSLCNDDAGLSDNLCRPRNDDKSTSGSTIGSPSENQNTNQRYVKRRTVGIELWLWLSVSVCIGTQMPPRKLALSLSLFFLFFFDWCPRPLGPVVDEILLVDHIHALDHELEDTFLSHPWIFLGL